MTFAKSVGDCDGWKHMSTGATAADNESIWRDGFQMRIVLRVRGRLPGRVTGYWLLGTGSVVCTILKVSLVYFLNDTFLKNASNNGHTNQQPEARGQTPLSNHPLIDIPTNSFMILMLLSLNSCFPCLLHSQFAVPSFLLVHHGSHSK